MLLIRLSLQWFMFMVSLYIMVEDFPIVVEIANCVWIGIVVFGIIVTLRDMKQEADLIKLLDS